MALGQILAGNFILAEDLQDELDALQAAIDEEASFARPITAVKAGPTSRNTSTSPTADPDLAVSLPANRTYDVEIVLLVTCAVNATGDIRIALGWTNTASVTYTGHGLTKALASGSTGDIEAFALTPDATTSTTAVGYGVSTVTTSITVAARVVVGGTAVTLSLLWALDTTSGNNTTVEAGSKMVARRAS